MRLAALLTLVLASTSARAEGHRVPVLVELFSSEGCSSCPPADALLREWSRTQPVAGVEIIPLELHVDYWNYLGWTDPYSQPAFTARQQSYARALHLESTYTPQAIVGGAHQLVGSDGDELQRALTLAAHEPRHSLQLSRVGADLRVQLDTAPSGPTELWVALTEANLSTQVRGGENRGRTLLHAPVVRRLERVAPLDARHLTASFRPPASALHQDVIFFLQAPDTGRILGVERLPAR